jgi:8-oxo-dGTP pyrophosphatase MutT (NUDIX family)
METLEFSTNPFGGVTVDPLGLPEDPLRFRTQLAHSIDQWTADGYKLVWVELPISRAAHIPVAVEAGFEFHHSSEASLMMTFPLVDGAFVPPYATHYVGVGAVVVSDAGELLVVSERYRMGGGRGPGYKLPGGALHPGEHLVDAVVREVHEETGIKVRFNSLACFRHWHGYRHGKSDIYFVCRLSPLTHEITMQEEEIAECLWMPVDKFLEDPSISPFNKTIVRAALDNPGIVPTFVEGYGDPARFEFFMPGDGTAT